MCVRARTTARSFAPAALSALAVVDEFVSLCDDRRPLAEHVVLISPSFSYVILRWQLAQVCVVVVVVEMVVLVVSMMSVVVVVVVVVRQQ